MGARARQRDPGEGWTRAQTGGTCFGPFPILSPPLSNRARPGRPVWGDPAPSTTQKSWRPDKALTPRTNSFGGARQWGWCRGSRGPSTRGVFGPPPSAEPLQIENKKTLRAPTSGPAFHRAGSTLRSCPRPALKQRGIFGPVTPESTVNVYVVVLERRSAVLRGGGEGSAEP